MQEQKKSINYTRKIGEVYTIYISSLYYSHFSFLIKHVTLFHFKVALRQAAAKVHMLQKP